MVLHNTANYFVNAWHFYTCLQIKQCAARKHFSNEIPIWRDFPFRPSGFGFCQRHLFLRLCVWVLPTVWPACGRCSPKAVVLVFVVVFCVVNFSEITAFLVTLKAIK